MPELTISLNDGDLAQLGKMGDELGLSERRMAERLLHRTIARAAPTPLVTHKQRSANRAVRHLELLRILRRRRFSTLGQAEKQALAKRFGVTERTIYRDLDILALTRGDAPGEPPTGGEPYPVATDDDTDAWPAVEEPVAESA